MTAPTPAELRALAARAAELAADIDAMQERLGAAPDEPTRRSGFRLDDAAYAARQIGQDLEETAGDLARIRGRGACPADWGVCPEHGNTLRYSGGECWCTASGCGRRWNYDRAGLPCSEQAAFEVRDATGGSGQMCAGHAMDAQDRIVGVTVVPL